MSLTFNPVYLIIKNPTQLYKTLINADKLSTPMFTASFVQDLRHGF